MKAVIENGKTYEVTGTKGAFTITMDVNKKVKMFVTSNIQIVDVEELPKAKVYKQSIIKKDRNYENDFNNRLHFALTQEHGRTGSLEFLKSL